MAGEKEPSPTPLLGGRYVLGEEFASGGMGSVHLGRIVGASGFSRVVAIKRLFPGFAGDPSFRRMLIDEARFAGRIRHPNVVPMLDVVEAESDLYVVMEYVHGLPLASLLERAGETSMPVEIAVAIAEATLLGLHAAHEARDEDGTPLAIVHRDVSPQNVLVGGDGVARVIDFGIAKAATRMQVTDPGTLKGKAAYMAPEQLLHEPVARHADVFAASVVLWEMLANRQLFPFDVSERVRSVGEALVPAGNVRGGVGVDAALDAIVLRGLARDPARRFPTAEAMAVELRRDRTVASPVDIAKWVARVAGDDLELSEERVRIFEQSPGVRSPDASTGSPLVRSVATSAIETAAAGPPTRRRRAWVGALVAALAMAAGLAAIRLAPRRATPVSTSVAPTALPVAAASTEPAPPSSTTPSSVAQAVPPEPSAPASLTAKPTGHAPPHARGATKGAVRPKCDPPYTLDADGFKHYDQRCF